MGAGRAEGDQVMPEQPSEEQLARYAAGDCSESEAEAIEAFLERSPEVREWVERARADAAWLKGVQKAAGRDETNADETREALGATVSAGGEQADDATLPGHTPQIEGYEIVRELSRGGQGVVYQAIQKATGRKVAVKVLIAGPHASPSARKRFEREIDLAAQLKHPHIVTVFDSGVTRDGHHFYAMEYVRGLPLNKYVRQNKLSLEDALDLFTKVCSAIDHAHRRGVIHRDLKPSNILVDVQGTPCVMDFGLAKMLAGPTHTLVSISGELVGTLPYMSPEQSRGNPDEIDTRTDVYALGVILYELLTGHYPYPVVGHVADVLKHIAETPPTPPTSLWTIESGVGVSTTRRLRRGQCPIDRDMETVVLRALAKEPDRRYQSAAELGRDIGHWLVDEPIDARRDSRAYVLKKTLAHYKRHFLVSAAVLLVLLVSIVTTVHARREARAEREAARLADEARAQEARALREAARLADEARAQEARAQREAARLLEEARSLIERRVLLPQARSQIDEAIRLAPYDEHAYMLRGLLDILFGLDAPIDEKPDWLIEAADDFLQAHLAAGGQMPDDTSPDPNATGVDRAGSRAALLSAANLYALADHHDDAEKLLALEGALARRQHATQGGADVADQGAAYAAMLSSALRFYDPKHDPLVVRKPAMIAMSPKVAHAEPDRSATLRRTLPMPPEGLNPAARQGYGRYVTELLFDRLLRKNKDLEIEWNPVLVESAQRADDGVTWDIVLGPGVTWHDGHALTAHDVAFSWDHQRDKSVPDKEALQSVCALDETHIRVVHQQVTSRAIAMWDMMFPLIPEHVYMRLGERFDDEFGHKPIGNGPYRMIEGDSVDTITLERWEHYPSRNEPKPYFRCVVFHIEPERAKRVRALACGTLDAVELNAGDFFWAVTGESFRGRVVKIHAPRWAYEYLCWNLAKNAHLFSDGRVRKALAHTLDLGSRMGDQYGGMYEPSTGIYCPDSWMFNASVERIAYDPDLANALLDDAGWRWGNTDGTVGYRTNGQRTLAFTLLVPDVSRDARRVLAFFQQSLRDVGISMAVEVVPPRSYMTRVRAGEFEAYWGAVRSAAHPDLERSRWCRAGAKNYGSYSNDEVDKKYDVARREMSTSNQKEHYQQIQQLIYEDQPYLFLWRVPTLWAFNSRLRGVEVSAQGVTGFYPGPRGWWMPIGDN